MPDRVRFTIVEPDGPNANGEDFSSVVTSSVQNFDQQLAHQEIQELYKAGPPVVPEEEGVVALATFECDSDSGLSIAPGTFVDRKGQRWESRKRVFIPGRTSGTMQLRLHKVPDPPPALTCWERIMGDDLF